MSRSTRLPPVPHFLREWRLEKKLTLEELGERINEGKDTVQRYETGERKMTLEMIATFARGLDIKPAALLRHPDEPSADDLLDKVPPSRRQAIVATFASILASLGYE